MKELKNQVYHSEEFDVDINCYLSYAEIENIINGTIAFQTWAEREQNINMLLVYYTTGIETSQLEEIGHNMLLQSGLVDEIRANVKNVQAIYDGIKYTESIEKAMTQIAQFLPKAKPWLDEMVKKYGSIKR